MDKNGKYLGSVEQNEAIKDNKTEVQVITEIL